MPDGAVDVLSNRSRISGGSRLPDQVSIDFGPPELLGPAFLQLDRAAREQGIYLSISHDLDELMDVNIQHRKHWYPLAPMFDSSLGGITGENGFWLRGVDDAGRVVATQAARLYFWPDTSFADEWEDLRFIYPDPSAQARPDEYCTADCATATKLSGRVCHTGALWLHPDRRGGVVTSILPRVTRAYALTRWYPEFTFGLAKVRPSVNARNVKRLYGWSNVDKSVKWYNTPHYGDLDFAIVSMATGEVLADLAEFKPQAGLHAAHQEAA